MYGFLTSPAGLIAWARRLVDTLNRRDADLEQRIKALEAKP